MCLFETGIKQEVKEEIRKQEKTNPKQKTEEIEKNSVRDKEAKSTKLMTWHYLTNN
jgi:hypothetical protein